MAAERNLNRGTFRDFFDDAVFDAGLGIRFTIPLDLTSINGETEDSDYTGTGDIVDGISAGRRNYGIFADCGVGPGSVRIRRRWNSGSYGSIDGRGSNSMRVQFQSQFFGAAVTTFKAVVGDRLAFTGTEAGIRWTTLGGWEAFTVAAGVETAVNFSAGPGGHRWRFENTDKFRVYNDGVLVAEVAPAFSANYAQVFLDLFVESTGAGTAYAHFGGGEISWPE